MQTHGWAAALTVGVLGLTSTTALAAGTDENVSEVIEVNAPPGKAPRPDLNLRINQIDYNIKTQDLRFPSGLRILFQRDPSQPVIAITAVTDHGSSDDPEGKEGIAHLVEHLWFRSEQGTLPKTWDLLESEMGCSLNAFTQYDITAYMTVCAGHNLDVMMALESLRMTNPIVGVTEDMVTTEVEVVRNEIRMRAENFNIPFFTVWEYVNKHMFPEGHPYQRPIAGNHTTIRNCKLDDIQAFTDAYYTPENTTIMVVGDLPSSDFNYLVDLVVRTFDLTLLDKDLTTEHLRQMPRPGIKNLDPGNPEHWYFIPSNPKNPSEPLPIKVQTKPRAAEFAGLIPPDPVTSELGVYEGPVEDHTVAISWTLPGGYQGDDTLLTLTGGVLNGIVGQGFSDPDATFGGCGALPSKRVTTVLCSATIDKDHDNLELLAERVADRMVDQVANMLNPDLRMILDMQLSAARQNFLVDILNSVDLYAAVGAGRATDTSQHAHFTGSAEYFTEKLNEVMRLQSYQIAEITGTWLKRDRVSSVLIKAMDRDDVAILSEDTAGSGGHARGGGESSILNPSIDPDRITPEFLRGLITLPDRSRFDDFTLPNGLRVVVVPHGEAPLVNVELIANGGTAVDTTGQVSFYSDLTQFDAPDPLRLAGRWLGGMWDSAEMMGVRAFSENLDGAMWLVRERVDTTRPDLSPRNRWVTARRKALKKNWMDADWQIRKMLADHVNPGHPTSDGVDWADLDVLGKTSGKAVSTALAEKWQPKNSTLLIVGKVDARKAREYAIRYFGGWRAKAGVEPKAQPAAPGPNPAKERAIYVFDDKGKTQTTVLLGCPLKPADELPSPPHELLGDIARMTMFTKLREEAGVVYSPYAGTRVSPGGSAMMIMSADIQNDSAVFAMDRYLEFLDQASAGKLSETDLRIKKLARASGYVLGQQSIDQMSNRLANTIAARQPWSFFERYADRLANTTLEQIGTLTEGCAEHAYVAFKGPKDSITKQLDEGGYTYEIIDPKEYGKAIYAEADPKGYEKYLKDQAKKKKKGDDEDEDEDDSEDGDDSAELTASF